MATAAQRIQWRESGERLVSIYSPRSTAPPTIEFRHVNFSFDELMVLRDVSFTVNRGQMIIVTGDSGSGKSVLLRLAMGLLRPDRGQIFVDGREIENLKEDQLIAIRKGSMGLMFQEDALFSGMSVYENAAYRLREHQWPDSDIDGAVLRILQFVGLEDALEKYPEELSGGMKRRLEFARAVVGWPSIMLYDEPTSGLDPINARQILDLIVTARDIHKITSLCVTKALQEIPYITTRCALVDEKGAVAIRRADPARLPDTRLMLLQGGSIAFFGDPAELKTSSLPAIVHLTHPELETLGGTNRATAGAPDTQNDALYFCDEHFSNPMSATTQEPRGLRRVS